MGRPTYDFDFHPGFNCINTSSFRYFVDKGFDLVIKGESTHECVQAELSGGRDWILAEKVMENKKLTTSCSRHRNHNPLKKKYNSAAYKKKNYLKFKFNSRK
ncbi:Oidioi.mRNA.OKI2018_I69.chr1.g1214.t1.cds [Oikopleura dioica]|uniref:Oidioi.mRNA.OKI2018_I69.chr1.g1214.t1.cds n=1 Tax=Oikopleura dioica TaxID=34765 RepID=A0ABN7SM92_OIKDI|nr:Oidioi.mRNA.OKI2018_I69.chr1.g1214.t1.cds [Oikopleura dioica]